MKVLSAAVGAALLCAATAQASTIDAYLYDDAGTLTLEFSGSVDTTGFGSGTNFSATRLSVGASDGNLQSINGTVQFVAVAISDGAFGTGTSNNYQSSTTVTGDSFGFNAGANFLYLPQGYASDDPLSGKTTTTAVTLAGTGAAAGSYIYDIGGTTTVNLTVGSAPGSTVIPLPAAGWLLLAGIGGLAAMRRRRG